MPVPPVPAPPVRGTPPGSPATKSSKRASTESGPRVVMPTLPALTWKSSTTVLRMRPLTITSMVSPRRRTPTVVPSLVGDWPVLPMTSWSPSTTLMMFQVATSGTATTAQ